MLKKKKKKVSACYHVHSQSYKPSFSLISLFPFLLLKLTKCSLKCLIPACYCLILRNNKHKALCPEDFPMSALPPTAIKHWRWVLFTKKLTEIFTKSPVYVWIHIIIRNVTIEAVKLQWAFMWFAWFEWFALYSELLSYKIIKSLPDQSE